ncbi:hypothetical protein AX774_g651 [Zancudomyces culisetae]|uniref:Uncharacterized protein n=1 Tax=Zancudomyces culisetae TaxID=1213189 RepID=A0A1R1PXY6_ZANCU|nr:hypothetical protein AX774_g651 [Zancudomyces culisetae]|eukprot:OMH85777.1 hypothetical protein AX774_g651 [Zancudomyces culisetae]
MNQVIKNNSMAIERLDDIGQNCEEDKRLTAFHATTHLHTRRTVLLNTLVSLCTTNAATDALIKSYDLTIVKSSLAHFMC